MVYTISHNGRWFGSFPTPLGAQDALVKKGWDKVPNTKSYFCLKRKGRVTIEARIICIARPDLLSELPSK